MLLENTIISIKDMKTKNMLKKKNIHKHVPSFRIQSRGSSRAKFFFFS